MMAEMVDKIYPLLGVVLLMWLSYAAGVACWTLIGDVCNAYFNVGE